MYTVPDPDGHPIPHVVFDFVHGWQPFDFPSGEMDYIAIKEEIGDLMDGFLPTDVTFDQSQSISMIQRLSERSRQTFKPASVYERTATAPINWKTAETTKVALALSGSDCFAGETQYMTKNGIRTLADTVGTTQTVVDRSGHWVEGEVILCGVQPLVEIKFTRTRVKKTVFATPGQTWFVVPAGQPYPANASKSKIVQTRDLRPGMRMAWMKPVSRLGRVKPSPYGIAHGIVTGDGSLGRNDSYVTLWGDKEIDLDQHFPAACGRTACTAPSGMSGVRIRNLPNAYKSALPNLDEAPSYLYGWLAGYFATDGNVSDLGQARLCSVRRENLTHAQRVCDRLGIGYYGISTSRMTHEWAASEYSHTFQLVGPHLTEDFFLLRKHRYRWTGEHGRVCLSWRVESVHPTDRVEEVFNLVVPNSDTFTLTNHLLTTAQPLIP